MGEITKHARYARQADFDERLAGGLIDDGTICFIEDTRQIWHHGNYYIEASGGGGSSWVPEPGAYVAYTDADGVNRIAKPSEYSSEGNTPCGVLVVHGGGSLLVGPRSYTGDEYPASWWDRGTTDTGGARASTLAQALGDIDGRRNTERAVLVGFDEAGEAYCALDRAPLVYEGNVPRGMWWVPSMGELKIIHDNIDAVEECLALIGGLSLTACPGYSWDEDGSDYGHRLWSSTQGGSSSDSTDNMWAWDFVSNTAGLYEKNRSVAYLRPVSRFAWVPDGYSGGGEPDYVEPETHPITAEPSRLDFDGSDFSDTERTVVVTSPTEWNEVGDYDKATIHVSPGSGPAGVTEVTVTIGIDESIDGTLVFEDGDGNTAEVYVDNHYGE